MLSDKETPSKLSRKLVRLYMLALSLVAFFSVIGQVLIQTAITDQQNYSRVINIAGRQRMLSQRLCKTSILLANPTIFMPDAEIYTQDINEILELWIKSHLGLKNGLLKLETDIYVSNSPKIDSMFKELDPIFKTIYQNAQIISKEIKQPSLQKNAIIQDALSFILKNERSFLLMMNKIVFQYDSEAKVKIDKLKKIELLLFFLTLIILVLEGIFIFIPSYKQINATVSTLAASENELFLLNEQLYSTNQSLIKTKEDLVRATEEKYRLQMKEDKVRSASIIEGQEEERKRMALDLHDGIGQMLTGLKLIAEKLTDTAFSTDKERKTFVDLKSLLDETIAETRVISFNLMPSVLNDFGLVSAIRLLIEQTQKNTEISILFNVRDASFRFNKNLEVTLYRICQEAINNTIKHAKASEIVIELRTSNYYIHFNIIDNGQGFDQRKLKSKTIKNGIRNMKARAELHNGELKISTGKNKGTSILVKMPLI
jgi:signal transduction histidine kinase